MQMSKHGRIGTPGMRPQPARADSGRPGAAAAGHIQFEPTVVETTDLPLASKLLQHDGEFCHDAPWRQIEKNGRQCLEFRIETRKPYLITEYQHGEDGIKAYELCRRHLLSIIQTVLKARSERYGGKVGGP
jgi:hypothetical protein